MPAKLTTELSQWQVGGWGWGEFSSLSYSVPSCSRGPLKGISLYSEFSWWGVLKSTDTNSWFRGNLFLWEWQRQNHWKLEGVVPGFVEAKRSQFGMAQGQWQAVTSNETWHAMIRESEGTFTQKQCDARINLLTFRLCHGQAHFPSFNASGSSTWLSVLKFLAWWFQMGALKVY